MRADRLAAALRDGAERELVTAFDGLTAQSPPLPLPDDLLRILFACLGHRAKKVQRGAAAVLVRSAPRHPAVVAGLHARLTDRDARVRWTAAFALSALALPDPSPLPVLIENLGHQESDLRWAAHTAILRVARRHPRTVLDAMLRLAHAGNAVQRRMALYCLRDLQQTDGNAQAAYFRSLSDTETTVRLAGISCLGKLRVTSEPLRNALVGLLKDDADFGVRRAAAVACGQIGDASPRIIEALKGAADADDASLAKAAVKAIEKVRNGS